MLEVVDERLQLGAVVVGVELALDRRRRTPARSSAGRRPAARPRRRSWVPVGTWSLVARRPSWSRCPGRPTRARRSSARSRSLNSRSVPPVLDRAGGRGADDEQRDHARRHRRSSAAAPLGALLLAADLRRYFAWRSVLAGLATVGFLGRSCRAVGAIGRGQSLRSGRSEPELGRVRVPGRRAPAVGERRATRVRAASGRRRRGRRAAAPSASTRRPASSARRTRRPARPRRPGRRTAARSPASPRERPQDGLAGAVARTGRRRRAAPAPRRPGRRSPGGSTRSARPRTTRERAAAELALRQLGGAGQLVGDGRRGHRPARCRGRRAGRRSPRATRSPAAPIGDVGLARRARPGRRCR